MDNLFHYKEEYLTDFGFSSSWKEIQKQVHNIAKSKGWWCKKRNDGEIIALIHSELSEALEHLRHNNPQSDHIPDFTGVEEELADVIIRIMDYAEKKKFNVIGALLAKIQFNSTRSFKHGGKKF